MSDLQRWAHIIDDVVVNVSLWDGVTAYDSGDAEMVLVDVKVGVGWTVQDGIITPPPPPEIDDEEWDDV